MKDRRTLVVSPPFLIGVAAPIVWATLGRLLGIWSSDWIVAALAAIYLAIGYFMWRGSWKNSVGPLAKVYLSLPIGIFLSVHVDWYLWRYDRGIWPVEMVIVWALALGPLLVGATIARAHRAPRPLS